MQQSGVAGDYNGDGIPDHMQPQAMLMLTVPPGHGGGMVVQMQTPDGQMLPVTLPPGAFPGQQMQVPYTPKQQMVAMRQPGPYGVPSPGPYGAPPHFAPTYGGPPPQGGGGGGAMVGAAVGVGAGLLVGAALFGN
eukprot:2264177-Prymnesium_polylepis.1